MSKTAIVTGGSRGIGRATAIELSKMGMNVAVIYCGNQAKAEETVASCKENGVDAIAIKCDVKVKDEVEAAVAKVQETFGSVDVLVNNAGVTKDGLLLRMSEEDFDTVIDTNLKGCFLFSKSCASIKREYYMRGMGLCQHLFLMNSNLPGTWLIRCEKHRSFSREKHLSGRPETRPHPQISRNSY